ncbi:MAG: response regulator transcription factor, partial [Opitutales bacterium]
MSNESVPMSGSRAAPGPGDTPRVVIVEDQRLIAEFLSQHCRSLGLTVLSTCATMSEGLAACRAQRPTLVLMDFSLGDGNGLEAARTLMAEFPALRVLGISSHRDPWTMLQVQRIGLHGFVDKHEPRPEELTKAIRTVLEGHTYYSQALNQA